MCLKENLGVSQTLLSYHWALPELSEVLNVMFGYVLDKFGGLVTTYWDVWSILRIDHNREKTELC